MYPGSNNEAVTIREVENGYVVAHCYSTGTGKNSLYNNDEYICEELEEALEKAEELLA